MGIICGPWKYTTPVIINAHPKGGMGKTISPVNIVGEMKSDTVNLGTHTGLPTILGLKPEGKEISVKIFKTVDELVEIMTPYKNSDKTLLIGCGGFDSDLTYAVIALTDCVVVPSKDFLIERIDLMCFDGILNEISSTMGTDITVHLYLCKVNPNKKRFPRLDTILPPFRYLKLTRGRISAHIESEDVIETGMGITESVHGHYSTGGKEVTAPIEEVSHLVGNNKQ